MLSKPPAIPKTFMHKKKRNAVARLHPVDAATGAKLPAGQAKHASGLLLYCIAEQRVRPNQSADGKM